MVNSEGRFVWYELMTTDVEAAKAFYSDIVGWGLRDASMPGLAYTLFTVEEVSVSGVMDLSDDAKAMGVRPSWIGYVGANDVDATADRLVRLGGTVHVPPTDTSNVSRFSVVADPQAAPLGLIKWLIPRNDELADPSMPGHIGWSDLLARDWEQALSFYGELFGWQRAEAVDLGPMGTYQLFSAGGQTIGGMFTKPPIVPAPFWLYYFNVEDIGAAAKRVRAGGGRILIGPMQGPGGSWILHCTDPQGGVFGLAGSGRSLSVASWSSEWSGRSLSGRMVVSKSAPNCPCGCATPSFVDKSGKRR
jgi:predicted enzyme related to lactoylglutathione lyase